MKNKRIEELEKLLEKECNIYEKDCSTCPCKAECEEYFRLYTKEN